MINIRTKNKVLDLIAKRFSPKHFSSKAIDTKTMQTILEAGRLAPSSYNEQPWRFIAALRTNKSAFIKLLECLSPKNAEWAKNSGALILSVAKTKFDHNGSVNRHALHDVGLATASMIFQAMSFGIYSHIMGGFSSEKAKLIYNIPADYEPVAVMAIGYLNRKILTEEKLEKKTASPRNRLDLDKIAFSEMWGEGF
jgi:nitroreductase